MIYSGYREYKDSGVEWLGNVPSDWEVRRLGSMFRQAIDEGESDLPILSVSIHHGVSDREFDEEELDRKVTRSEDRSKYRKVQTGDLVYNMMRAWQGGFGAVSVDGMVSPAYVVARPIGEFSTPYVERLLRTPQAIEQMRRYSQGVTDFRLRLYWDEFKAIRIPLPPLDEQKAISSFLDVETSKIDGLVSEQRRLIELLKEKRQAVISHAVTKGLNPNAPMKPSGIQWLGDVPQHWEVQRIKHAITSIEQGWSPQCEISPVENESQWGVLKVGCVNYGKFTAKQNKALPAALEPKPELGIKKDDLLISRANTIELVGSATVVESDHDRLMLCDKLYRLRMDSGKLLPTFLCYFLTCELAREPIELGASGASPSMKNIAQSVILELWFASPDVEEQAEIVDAIRERWNAITSLIAEAERAIELLQERRTALISAAVTGKIDVREFTSCERQGASRRPVRATKQNEAK